MNYFDCILFSILDSTARTLMYVGGVHSIIHMMENDYFDCILFFILDSTARTLMYVGGVHSIIHMMEKYNNNTDVLQHGCTALGTFASHGNLNPLPHRDTFKSLQIEQTQVRQLL